MVDNVAENVMSGHYQAPISADLTRLTEGQLDRMTESLDIYNSRINVRDGRTWFVDSASEIDLGTPESPFKSIGPALQAADASGSDIILLRPGQYKASLTINSPVTLRATRQGPVTLGFQGLPVARKLD